MIVPRRVAKVPLRNRKHEIIAYALVDPEDYERVINAAGWCLGGGYVHRTKWVGGKERIDKLHRFILNIPNGDPRHVDHKDINPLNNCKYNLRVCTSAENAQNQPSHRGSSSKYRGVYWNTTSNKWVAQCKQNGRRSFIRYFDDEEEAHQAVSRWRADHMPFSQDARSQR